MPDQVLLISCYELGHQPHGVTVAAAFLERAGFRPARLDLSRCRLDEQAVRRAKLVALSVPMHTALRVGIDAMHRIRAINPAAFVSAYGLYAWLNGEYLLDGLADAVIGGEYEQALVALVQDLAAGGTGHVPGVWRRGRPAAPIRERLAFPTPARDGLPGLASYARLIRGDGEAVVAYTETTRGCLHHCLHCPIPPVYGGRFFAVPSDVVLEDIRQQVKAGARHVTFGDPDFLNGPGHGLRILRALHAEWPDVSFDCTAKIEHLLDRRDLLPELRVLGCAFIVSAVESLSDRVLRHLAKGHTRADVFAAVALLRQSGHTLRPSLIPFTPWSTPADYVDLLEWAAREDLVDAIDPVQWSIRLLVPPGSALLGKPWMEPYLTGLDGDVLTYRWVHPDPRMDALHDAVRTIVADAAETGQDVADTFARVREAARIEARPRGPSRRRPPAPRLSEPWFC